MKKVQPENMNSIAQLEAKRNAAEQRYIDAVAAAALVNDEAARREKRNAKAALTRATKALEAARAAAPVTDTTDTTDTTAPASMDDEARRAAMKKAAPYMFAVLPNIDADTDTTAPAKPRDTYAFHKAALEAAAARYENNPNDTAANDAAARAYINMGCCIANSVLKRAFDPTRRRYINTENAIEEARRASMDDEARRAAVEAAAAPATLHTIDAAAACNAGASVVIEALQRSTPADVDGLYSMFEALDTATQITFASGAAKVETIDAAAAERATKALEDVTLSDGMDVINSAIVALLEARKDSASAAALNWLETEYKALSDGENAAPASPIRRANKAAERYINGRRGLSLSDSKTVYIEDYTTTDKDGNDVNGLDVLYKKAGRFANLGGYDCNGLYTVEAGTVEHVKALLDMFNFTPAQARRLLYRANGMSYRAIADAEHVAANAVEKSIAAAAKKAVEVCTTRAAAARAAADSNPADDEAARRAKTLELIAARAEKLDAARARYADTDTTAPAPMYTSSYTTPVAIPYGPAAPVDVVEQNRAIARLTIDAPAAFTEEWTTRPAAVANINKGRTGTRAQAARILSDRLNPRAAAVAANAAAVAAAEKLDAARARFESAPLDTTARRAYFAAARAYKAAAARAEKLAIKPAPAAHVHTAVTVETGDNARAKFEARAAALYDEKDAARATEYAAARAAVASMDDEARRAAVEAAAAARAELRKGSIVYDLYTRAPREKAAAVAATYTDSAAANAAAVAVKKTGAAAWVERRFVA